MTAPLSPCLMGCTIGTALRLLPGAHPGEVERSHSSPTHGGQDKNKLHTYTGLAQGCLLAQASDIITLWFEIVVVEVGLSSTQVSISKLRDIHKILQ